MKTRLFVRSLNFAALLFLIVLVMCQASVFAQTGDVAAMTDHPSNGAADHGALNNVQIRFDDDLYKLIPVLHEGRIKPLGSFARHIKHNIMGDQDDAISFLNKAIFNPAQAAMDHPDEFSENAQVLRSFSMILPLSITYNDQENVNFLMLKAKIPEIEEEIRQIIKDKGGNPENYSEEELKKVGLGYNLQKITQSGAQNALFKVIPVEWAENKKLAAPWQLINDGLGSPKARENLDLWADLANAYRHGDHDLWAQNVRKIYDNSIAHLGISPLRLQLEIRYIETNPYLWVILLLGASLFFMGAARLRPWRGFEYGALISAGGAALALLATIGLRIFILQRPPVGTLYESILFVALLCALAGVVLYRSLRLKGLGTGVFAGFSLLVLAPNILQNPDSLGVLSAVLNTNFWLATHVLVITAGYALCILTALAAHLYLYHAGGKTRSIADQLTLGDKVYNLSLISLLLTAVGTILGGIWADQSWGRFWGWDPKENGALLIVLWLVWIEHGRITGKLKPLMFQALSACLTIIVALAWFGVNLLSTGLHSYGFIDGIAYGLAGFCTLQLIVIAALYIRAYRSNQ